MSTKEQYKVTINNIIKQIGGHKFKQLVREIDNENTITKQNECEHKFISSPICGDPDWCVKCGKTQLND